MATVTKSIGRISSDTLYPKKGRKKLTTPTKMKNGINKYFQWCEENGRVPSIKGLMIHQKMRPDMFKVYIKYPEFTDLLEQARLIIKEWCENDIYTTQGPTAGKIAYMKNVHDWTDKVEQKSEVTQTITYDEARARIEMLAPKLLEMLRNSNALPENVVIPAPNKPVETIVEAEVDDGMDFEEEPAIEVDLTPRRVVR